MILRTLLTAWAIAAGLGLAVPAAAKNVRATADAPAYVDMYDYLPTWQERDAWLDVSYALKANFDDVCGDTFCEGDYPNLEALSYRCSVQATTGEIGQCVFVFAASSEEVNPADGKVRVSVHQWQCASPLAPHTDARQFLAALQGGRPIWTALPGSGQTIYDGLVDCL